MNWLILSIITILIIALIIFLIIRNKKDEKRFENELKNSYPKHGDENGEIDIDKLTNEVH